MSLPTAELGPQALVVTQELRADLVIGDDGVDLDEREAVVTLLAEQAEQLAVGIAPQRVPIERVDVAVAHPGPEQLEGLSDASLLDILRVGVPGHADRLVAT